MSLFDDDGAADFRDQFDDDDDDRPYLFVLIKHPNGKFYEATVSDVTEGGLILAVETKHVRAGIFPENYIDTRYLGDMNLKVFFVHKFHEIPC